MPHTPGDLTRQIHGTLLAAGKMKPPAPSAQDRLRQAEADHKRPEAAQPADAVADAPWRGTFAKKPWHYRVTAVIPHRGALERLERCLQFIARQSEQPYVMLIDTDGDDESFARVRALRSEAIEIHRVACHATEEYADAACFAMDLAMSACRTEYLWCLPSDCFVVNSNMLAQMLAMADDGRRPVIGYESLSAAEHPECKGMVSEACTLLHMPTMRRLDVTWSRAGLAARAATAGQIVGFCPEISLNYRLRERGIEPLLLGSEHAAGIERDENCVHLRRVTFGADLLATQPGSTKGKKVVLKELRAMICDSASIPRTSVATARGIETFNLIYFIAPFANSDVWRWNVGELTKRLQLFNGRRIVAIATGPEMSPAEEVMRDFAGRRVRFVVDENDPCAGESTMFCDMLSLVQSSDPCEATFYAHAKGVSKTVDESVRQWTRWMYEYCLDDVDAVRKALESHSCAGAFKTAMGNPPENFPGNYSLWHFSGTFFWFRNSALFSRQNWRELDRHFWGTEAYLSKMFKSEEAYCFFCGTDRPGAMYDPEFIRAVAMPEHRRRLSNRAFQEYVDAGATQDVNPSADCRYSTSLAAFAQPC